MRVNFVGLCDRTLLPISGLGNHGIGFAEGGGSDKIADRHALLLSSRHDFVSLLLGVVRKDRLTNSIV
jgi:hypothetical protein